jgi:methionine-rich copper-binding protein CopC
MSVVVLRVLVERLLKLVFGLTATATIFQGLAMVLALAVTYGMPGRATAPSWVGIAITHGVMIAVAFVVGGAVLGFLRNGLDAGREAPAPGAAPEGTEGRTGWIMAALVPTLALPAVAVALSWNLFTLSNDLLIAMDRLGVRAALARGADPFAGLVLLPVVAVMFAPALQMTSAFYLIAVPPLLLALLVTRGRRFGAWSALAFGAQATYVLAALAGTDLFVRLIDVLMPVLRAEGGAEAAPWLPLIAGMRATLVTTAWRHVALLGVSGACLGGLALLRSSRVGELERTCPPGRGEIGRDARPFDAESTRPPYAAAAAPSREAAPSVAPAPAGRAYDSVSALPDASRQALDQVLARFRIRRGEVTGEPAASQTVAPAPSVTSPVGFARSAADPDARAESGRPGKSPIGAIARVLLFAWGGLMLFSGACQLVWPRAHFVDSSPAAGGSLPRPPSTVAVRFDHALDPASTIRVQRAQWADGTPDGSGEPFHRASRLDPGDPEGRTLSAELRADLGVGIYRVDWQAMPASGGGARSGWFYFGVGRGVPDDLAAAAGRPYQERDAGARGRRATLLAGVVLLALASFLPQLARNYPRG